MTSCVPAEGRFEWDITSMSTAIVAGAVFALGSRSVCNGFWPLPDGPDKNQVDFHWTYRKNSDTIGVRGFQAAGTHQPPGKSAGVSELPDHTH